jgi:CDP-diacylglycerol--serine O-phosphatidyltransferase
MLKKYIPNLFTLLNLLSGIIAILLATTDRLVSAAMFVFLGIFFDFFDGFFARKFNLQGELGKQLDSLADVVTSGVAPGIVMFQLLLFACKGAYFMQLASENNTWQSLSETYYYFLPFLGLLIPLASAYRLANFNIDERQSDSFIGLPTPALSLFVMSLPLIVAYSHVPFAIELMQNKYFLIVITLIGCYLLNAELPLFSLKFKSYTWTDNKVKYLFLIISVILLVFLKTVSIPLIIILYVLISVFANLSDKKKVA